MNGTTLAPRQTILPAFHASTADEVLTIREGQVTSDHLADELVHWLLPTGTVAPYAGTPSSLAASGWLLCDGAEYPVSGYPDLARVLGATYGGNGTTTFHVPDYRGRFLRGVDDPDGDGGLPAAGRDPEASARKCHSDTGTCGDRIGSVQPDATALPKTVFTTSVSGSHNHQDPFVACNGGTTIIIGGLVGATKPCGATVPQLTSLSPEHSHEVSSGGDPETRPLNVAVNWIIKCGPNDDCGR